MGFLIERETQGLDTFSYFGLEPRTHCNYRQRVRDFINVGNRKLTKFTLRTSDLIRISMKIILEKDVFSSCHERGTKKKF